MPLLRLVSFRAFAKISVLVIGHANGGPYSRDLGIAH